VSHARWTIPLCVICVTGGAAWGKAPEVKIVTPPDTITVSVGQAVPFEASIATDDTERSAPKTTWLWDFGDKATSDKNPSTHAFGEAGIYKVTVTATTDDGTGTASVEVIVTSGEGGGEKDGADSIYIRDVTPPRPTIANDQACDCVHVVFETTNSVMGMPALSKQSVPGGAWVSMGTATEEQTGIPGKRRWWWAWPTWPEKNADVNFKVVYTKPMPPTQITVGPVTFTPNNTVVSNGDGILKWDGTNAVTVPWTITHSPYDSPLFDVTVAIYPVGSTSPVKTFVLEDQPLSESESSLEWEGETDSQPPGQTAPPGIYAYKVTALHVGEGPGCEDTDKSAFLTISNVTLSDFEWIPDTHPPQAKVWLEWDLSIDAESSRLEIYAPCLNQVDVIEPPDQELAPTAGHHFRWVYFEVCPAHMGNYTFVIYAGETAATGDTHRGMEPKPALQGGAVIPIWPPAYAGAGDDDWLSGYNEYLHRSAECASEELGDADPASGMHWASAWGAGPSQCDSVFERMDAGPVAVLATATHGWPEWINFKNKYIDNTEYLLKAELIEMGFHCHGINELDSGDLEEALLVFLKGCSTAREIDMNEGLGEPDMHRPLCEAVMAKGAQAFAGFELDTSLLMGPEWSGVFWDGAVRPAWTLLDAALEAQWHVEDINDNDDGGYASFWSTNLELELFPPRFSSGCVGD